MVKRRVVLVITGIAVAGLGVATFLVGLDQANRYAGVVGALAGVAGVGLAWAGLVRGQTIAQPSDEPLSGENSEDRSTGASSVGRNAEAKFQVDMGHARGTYIGDGGTQNNTF